MSSQLTKEEFKQLGLQPGKIYDDVFHKAFSPEGAVKMLSPIQMKEQLLKIIEAERSKTEKFTDSKVPCEIGDKNPSKVEDKTEASKDLPKSKEGSVKAPAGTRASKKETKGKYTNLSNYIPTEIKRDEKDEVPTLSGKFDEKLAQETSDKELEDNFDDKHMVDEGKTWKDAPRNKDKRQPTGKKPRPDDSDDDSLNELSPETYMSVATQRAKQSNAAQKMANKLGKSDREPTSQGSAMYQSGQHAGRNQVAAGLAAKSLNALDARRKKVVRPVEGKTWKDKPSNKDRFDKFDKKPRPDDFDDDSLNELSPETYKSVGLKRAQQANAARKIANKRNKLEPYPINYVGAAGKKGRISGRNQIANDLQDKSRRALDASRKKTTLPNNNPHKYEARTWLMGDRIGAMNVKGEVRHFALQEIAHAQKFAFASSNKKSAKGQRDFK